MPPAVAMTRVPVRPIAEYVLKVASRCNLACDHCYVYGDPDRGWLRRPTVMDPATVAAAIRIAEHAARHGLDRVTVILHGGEPLLVGGAALGRILAQLRSVIDPVAELALHLQSNGVRLTPAVCELLADQDVKVGISLDGDRLANDRHRRFADGTGSHDHVLREEPPRIDFLLPHATWDHPSPRPEGQRSAYADWLLTIYDRWTADGWGVPIRIFDSVVSLERGAGSGTEAIGPGAGAVAVIETDGSWEQVDSLKTVSEDAPRTGLDVRRHAVDEVAAHAGVVERQAGELSQTCRACSVVDTCGGGLDRSTTPAQDVGAFAEFIRQHPEAVRSDHPQTSFTALGPAATELTRAHALDCHLGERSPLAKLYPADAIVLLLGEGLEDVCTCFHLAEHRLPTPAPQRLFRCYVLEGGRRTLREFMAAEADDSDFGRLGAAMAARSPFVHRGRVGRTTASWFPLRAAVDFAVDWMSRWRPG